MKLVALPPVQVGYGKNRNELGALPHYQQLLYYGDYCNERKWDLSTKRLLI